MHLRLTEAWVAEDAAFSILRAPTPWTLVECLAVLLHEGFNGQRRLTADLSDQVILAGEDAVLMINGYYFAVLCSVIFLVKALQKPWVSQALQGNPRSKIGGHLTGVYALATTRELSPSCPWLRA